MEDLDMSGVDPLRRAEIRRRVDVVKAFVALPSPSDAERKTHAAALGLSVNQFMALTRAWREHSRASSLAGSGSSRGTTRKTGPRHLDDDVRRAAERTVADLAAGASLAAAISAVAAACASIGKPPPSATTVWKMHMRARGARFPSAEDGVVVAGRCWVRLPVIQAGELVMPSLAVAVNAADGVIMAATMVPDSSHYTLVGAFAANVAGLRQLHVDGETFAGMPAAAAALARVSPPSTIRRHLARTLGDRIDGIRLVFKAGAHARPERLLRARKDEPLSDADAAAVVRAAIDSSNAARGGARTLWID